MKDELNRKKIKEYTERSWYTCGSTGGIRASTTSTVVGVASADGCSHAAEGSIQPSTEEGVESRACPPAHSIPWRRRRRRPHRHRLGCACRTAAPLGRDLVAPPPSSSCRHLAVGPLGGAATHLATRKPPRLEDPSEKRAFLRWPTPEERWGGSGGERRRGGGNPRWGVRKVACWAMKIRQ